ncbi:ribosomal protein S18 [Cryptococcus depauperatus]|nr:ribosomal protein S18 [Cryptococcus depauperatus CBS 7855]
MSLPWIPCIARYIHTTASRSEPRSFVAIMNSSISQATNSSGAQPFRTSNTAQTMVGKKEMFGPNSFVRPQSFTHESLYPTNRPMAKAPLLGPPRKIAVKIDPFHITKTNPLAHDMNPFYAYEFVNQMGKLRSRAETGLTWKSQRRVGKLVRRARAMGIISRWTNRPVPGGLGSYY